MILPLERRNKIVQLIQKHKHMKISELSTTLSVSEMTIHRDIKPLIEDGTIIKTYGGVYLKEDVHSKELHTQTDKCVVCNQHVHERLCYRLILSNQQIESTCCAHCGLIRHQQMQNQVLQAIVPDFLKHNITNATIMHYVFDTSLKIGCCEPQVLPFEQKEDAEKFVLGFGGTVYTFEESIQMLHHNITNTNCCSTTKDIMEEL